TLGERLPGSLQFPLVVGHCVQFCVTPRLPFPLCELRRAKPASATMGYGGVPERSNGAVLKTAGGRKVARGFKSHPRRRSGTNSAVQRDSSCSVYIFNTADQQRARSRPGGSSDGGIYVLI